MRLLADTHTVLWSLFDDQRLPASVRDNLNDPANEVLVSVVSAWEFAIKRSLGKLNPPGEFEEGVRDSGFQFLPLTPPHCREYEKLPYITGHRDPFDRMLVVQAQWEGCHLVSIDETLDGYGVRRLW